MKPTKSNINSKRKVIEMWSPPEASSAILILPLTYASCARSSPAGWKQGVLPVRLPIRADRLEPWSEDVINEKERSTLVDTGPQGILYPDNTGNTGQSIRLHLILPEALGFGSLLMHAMEFIALPNGLIGGEEESQCAVMALHFSFPKPEGSDMSLIEPMEDIRRLSNWDPLALNAEGTDRSINQDLVDHVRAAIPEGWVAPERGTRLGICTFLLQNEASNDPGFLPKDWMYLSLSSLKIRSESISDRRRDTLPFKRMSTSWEVLVLRDGIAVLAANDDFTSSLQSYFHSIYLDAILLAKLQSMRISELSRYILKPELTDRIELRKLEGAVLEFRRRIWWPHFTKKRKSHADRILSLCQNQLDLDKQVLALVTDAADAARLASSLHQEAQTTAQESTRRAQEKTNSTIQSFTVLLAPLALSYAAFAVMGNPGLGHFIAATVSGIGLTAVSGAILLWSREKNED